MTPTRTQRDILKAAYKAPQTEETLGARLVEALVLVGGGHLTAGPSGFSITPSGCKAIGKKPPRLDLGAMAREGLDELVEPAIAVIQKHKPPGDEDHGLAVTLLLTFCVAVGILARVVEIDAASCMQAINVGRKVKLSDRPGVTP